MRVDTAVNLVNNDLVFWPNWKISAEDYSHRFEDTICVSFEYESRNYVRGDAPDYPNTITATAKQAIVVADMKTPEDLLFAVLKRVEKIQSHEAREAMRLRSTNWAPFYPHKVDGQKRWAEKNGCAVDDDLIFGVA